LGGALLYVRLAVYDARGFKSPLHRRS
jgi:hypothetical protein